MPRKVPSPAGSLQYSPPPMEYPRNSNPDPPSSSSSVLLPLIYATASSPLPCSDTSYADSRTHAPCTLAQTQGLPLCSWFPPRVAAGGNGDWRDGDQGWPGGSAAAALGRGHAPPPRRALRRAVSVRVSLLAGPCSLVSFFFSWCGLRQGWFLALCALLAGSMRFPRPQERWRFSVFTDEPWRDVLPGSLLFAEKVWICFGNWDSWRVDRSGIKISVNLILRLRTKLAELVGLMKKGAMISYITSKACQKRSICFC